MKKIYLLAMLLCAGFAFTSCDDDDENVVTVDFEGDTWSSLIDSKQYGGDLLYGANASTYAWKDANTGLAGGMTNSWGGLYGFAEGGCVISNYIDSNIKEHNAYDYQLAVPVKNDGSNFVVCYCGATITLPQAAVIKSMDIINTTYTLGVMNYGDQNGYASALTNAGDYLTLVITANTGTVKEIDLARDGKFIDKWKRVSLEELGEVTSLTFSMKGSDSSSYGPKTPTYFAFDNVKVVQ